MNTAFSTKQNKVLDLCYQEMDSILRFKTSPKEHIRHQPVKEHYDSIISRLNKNVNFASTQNDIRFLNQFQKLTENLIKLHDLGEILGEPATFFDYIRVPSELKKEFGEQVNKIENSAINLVFAKAFNLLNESSKVNEIEQIDFKFKKLVNELKENFANIQTNISSGTSNPTDNQEWAKNKIQNMKKVASKLKPIIKSEETKIKSPKMGGENFKEYKDLINFFSWLDSFPGVQVQNTKNTLKENNIYKNTSFKEESKAAFFDIARSLTHFLDKFDGSSYAIDNFTDKHFEDKKKEFSNNSQGILDDLKKHMSRFQKPFQYFSETLDQSISKLDIEQKKIFNKLKMNLGNQVKELERKFQERFGAILKN